MDFNNNEIKSLYESLLSSQNEPSDVIPDLSTTFKSTNDLQIMEELEPYNKEDLLLKFAGLRLFFENRNKAPIIDQLIQNVLIWLRENKWNYSGYPISYGKFKKILRQATKEYSFRVDPLENPFIANVCFYNNYKVMPGINNHSFYNLQQLLKPILAKSIESSSQKQIDTEKVIFNHIQISDGIVNKVVEKKLVDNVYSEKELFCPSKALLEEKINSLVLKESDLETNDLILEQEELKEKLSANDKEYCFLEKPYFRVNNKIIILDLTSIAFALIRYIIKLYKSSSEQLTNPFKNSVRGSLGELGHYKIKNSEFLVSLIDSSGYTEEIYSISRGQKILILQFINYEFLNEDISIDQRLKYITESLKDQGIDRENIYVLNINDFLNAEGISSSLGENSRYYHMTLTTFELYAVSINEKDNFFLPRYMKAKAKFLKEDAIQTAYGDMNLIRHFSENNMSFYISDDYNPMDYLIFIGFEGLGEYYEQALESRARKSFYSEFLEAYIICMKHDYYNYYAYFDKREKVLIAFLETGINIEILTNKITNRLEIDLYKNLIDMFAYWLSEYYKDGKPNIYKIVIELESDTENYFELNSSGQDGNIECYFNKEQDTIKVIVDKITYQSLGMDKSNLTEKRIIECIIEKIDGIINKEKINKMFEPLYKQIFFGRPIEDYEDEIYLPLNTDSPSLKVSKHDEEQLEDFIGQKIKSKKYKSQKKQVDKKIVYEVVELLYAKLVKEAGKFNKEILLEALYEQLEMVIPNILNSEKRYHVFIELKYDKKDEIFNEINETTKVSRNLKFLIEYVAATDIKGDQIIGPMELEELLAICSKIIEWADVGEVLQHSFADTTFELLESGRIGFETAEFSTFHKAMFEGKNEQLDSHSFYFVVDDSEYTKRLSKLYNNHIEKSFFEEFGFNISDFTYVIKKCVDIAKNSGSSIYTNNLEDLIGLILENTFLSKEDVLEIIKCFSLNEREDYLTPPQTMNQVSHNDIVPWKFNRELSFIRRPFIISKGKILFGIRSIVYAYKFLFNKITSGKYKSKSKEMNKLISKIANIEGERFNSKVYSLVNNIDNITADLQVKKIGDNHIRDNNNNDLGDIDILAFDKNKNRIFVIEAKNFNFSKNAYEIKQDHKKIFDGEKSFTNKLLKRAEWVKKNIQHILNYYSLSTGNWEVKSVFVLSEHLIAGKLAKESKVDFVTIHQLESYLKG